MGGFKFRESLLVFVRHSLLTISVVINGLVITDVYAAFDSSFLSPGDQIYPDSIPTDTGSPSYLVNPNGPSNFFYGAWFTDSAGILRGSNLPTGLVGSDVLYDGDFYQRTIQDSSTGENYIQLIVIGDAGPDEGFGEVGMFSESYVKMGSGQGVSVLQGLRCTPDSGKCPAPAGSIYPGGQASPGVDSLAKIRTDDFEDPREKYRFTQLIYDTDDASKWADYRGRGTEGTTFYSDIWGGSYNYVDSDAGVEIELGDFTNTVTKTLDINNIYSYATMTAEMQFKIDDRDKEIAESLGIMSAELREEMWFEDVNPLYSRISVLSEAEKLTQNQSDKFANLDAAIDYIENYVQYRVIAQRGWREQAENGLERHDMRQETFQGAVVKAGNVTYRKDFLGETITATWEDGDRVDHYSVDEVLAMLKFGHEQVTPDNCDFKTPLLVNNQCTQEVRYQFATLDEIPLLSEINYDSRVGDQFVVEDTDQVNPFDPFSTRLHLP